MNIGQRDRTTSDAPWKDPKPTAPSAIPEDAVHEAGFAYWIEGDASDYRIMCAGAGSHFEIQRDRSWYPDEIYAREQKMLFEKQ